MSPHKARISTREKKETDLLLEEHRVLNNTDSPRALAEAQKLYERCAKTGYRAAEAQLAVAEYLRNCGRWHEALAVCEELLTKVREEEDPLFYCRLRAEYMRAHLGTNRVDDYLRVTTENVPLFEKHAQTHLLGTTYLHLCRIHYYYLKNDERALHFAEKAIAIGRPVTQLEALRVVVQIYTYSHQTEKALPYLERALQLALQSGEEDMHIMLQLDKAFAHRELKQFDAAIEQLLAAAKLPKHRLMITHRAAVFSALSDCYQQTGQAALFEKYVTKAMDLLPQVPNPQHYNILCQAAMNYYALGRHERAFELHQAFHQQYKTYFVRERDEQVASLQATFDKEQALRDLQLLQLKNQALENAVAARQREMNLLATYLLERNTAIDEFLKQVKDEVQKLGAEHMHAFPIRNLLERLKENTPAADEQPVLDEQLLQLNRAFMQRLKELYPTLSATELKVCALVAAELPNKSIAILLRISPRTVENHRQSIQKKVALPKDTTLLAWLRKAGW